MSMSLEEKKAAARARAQAARAADASDAESFTLTPAAAAYIARVAADADRAPLLRVTISAGGCAGFEYRFDILERGEEPRADDRVVECDGVRACADLISALRMAGARIDYESSLARSGLVVTNPQASASCGCGKSFSV